MEYPIIDVTHWLLDTEKGTGKGLRKKSWLIDPSTNKTAMFKFPREGSGEHWAEKLCSEIANVLDIPCANVDIAIKNGEYGCLSYFFVDSEGGYSHFDGGTFFPYDYDDEKNIGYNVHLIQKVLSKEDIPFEKFLFVIFFDALVANGDRHQDNWGITRHDITQEQFISPLYDNSACLCRDINNEKALDTYCNSDEELLRYIYKGKSKIGWNEKKNAQHFFLIRNLTKVYPSSMKELFSRLHALTDNVIDSIINKLPNEVISNQQKLLVSRFLKKRRNIMVRIGENMKKRVNELFLIWKNPETRQRYTVGKLSYNENENTYTFGYLHPYIDEAVQNGFSNYPNFPDLSAEYKLEGKLFKDIKNRLPQPKRPDYAEILEHYNLDSTSSDMEILEATRGRIATDNFEFVRDFKYTTGLSYDFTFDLAAARYYDFQSVSSTLKKGDAVELNKDEMNLKDHFAVEVKASGVKLGYVPRYYSQEISKMIDDNVSYKAFIEKLDIDNPNPDEWVQLRIKIIVEPK